MKNYLDSIPNTTLHGQLECIKSVSDPLEWLTPHVPQVVVFLADAAVLEKGRTGYTIGVGNGLKNMRLDFVEKNKALTILLTILTWRNVSVAQLTAIGFVQNS